MYSRMFLSQHYAFSHGHDGEAEFTISDGKTINVVPIWKWLWKYNHRWETDSPSS